MKELQTLRDMCSYKPEELSSYACWIFALK